MKRKLSGLLGLALLLGACIRPLEIPSFLDPANDASWPPAALVMRQALGQQLGVAPADITLVAAEAVIWPDGCLGAGRADELCLAAATPGYLLIFATAGSRYVFHTDQDASSARLVEAPAPEIGAVALTWTQTDTGGACRQATIGTAGVAFGPCFGVLLGGIYGQPTRAEDLQEFAAAFAPFHAETPAGVVDFRGYGAGPETRPAAPAEQRMIAEWARLVTLEAEAGRSGASWGLIFAWRQEHTTKGECVNVTVYVTGDAYVAACAGEPPQTLAHVRLAAEQLQTVYGWLDTYAPQEWLGDATGAPDLPAGYRVVFSGAGDVAATPQLREQIDVFAAALWQAAVNTSP